MLTVRAMIDCGTTWNFISQLKVMETGLQGIRKDAPKLATIDGSPFKTYERHSQEVGVKDEIECEVRGLQEFWGADIAGVDVILGLPWLRWANPRIDWAKETLRFPGQSSVGAAAVLPFRPIRNVRKPKAPIPAASTVNHDDRVHEGQRQPLDIAVVNKEEFARLCKAEGVQAFVLDYKDLRGDPQGAASIRDAKAIELPSQYSEFEDVFDPAEADILPKHGPYDHAIELEEGKEPPFGPVYNMSVTELDALREYVDEMLAKGFIRPSKSPAGAPVMFVKKKDGGLRLCVDYRGLNDITIKNRYPIPLIAVLLDRLVGAWLFTKLDLIAAYNALRIRAGDEWKTAFRCRYGHFEYLVMSFGLTNAPATFQSYIHMALREFLDVFVIVFLDDILIYTPKGVNHEEHVKKVLEKLRQYNLHAKLSKCGFHLPEIDFLGFIVTREGVRMDLERVASILNWPLPASHKDVQVFMGFANFYRRFIDKFSQKARALTSLLKGSIKGKFPNMQFTMTEEAKTAFQSLKEAFTSAPMLRHFDPRRKIRLETDASGFAISAVISQLVEETGQWHPVAFWSRKMCVAEMNYGIGESEMLAIVEAAKQWRHYLEGSIHKIQVITDHCNLKTFLTTKDLSRREARWWERLSGLDLAIEYRPGKLNPADGPSRRPDYQAVIVPDTGIPDANVLDTTQYVLSVVGDEIMDPPISAITTKAKGSQPSLKSKAQDEPQPRSQLITSKLPQGSTASCTHPDAEPDDIQSAVKKALQKKAKKNSSSTGNGTSKPSGLRLVHRDPDDPVSRETIRKVSEEESAFAAPSLELHTVLRLLQETDHFSQSKWPSAVSATLSGNNDDEQDSSRELESGSEREEPRDSSVQGENEDTGENQWRIEDKILCFKGKWYIPHGLLRRELLRQNHDDPNAGHFGYARTLELLRRKYWWQDMSKDVREYVMSCSKCHQVKPARHKPFGVLQPLPRPKGPRQAWSMDFITDLPPSLRRGTAYDAILVIVDRFTKYSRYILARKDWDAEMLADVLVEEVFTRFGMPVSIVSDRGTLFTSGYWSQFCYYLRVRLNYSTAFHPQTDGQTERQNSTLEQYLRCYINYQQDDWAYWLPMAEYAYNNSRHAVTQMSPFQAIFGEVPRWEEALADVREDEVPAARRRAEDVSAMKAKLEARLAEAAQTQAKYYNRKHLPKTYNIGDKVYLNMKYIKSTRPSKKLDNKYYGPVEVEMPVGKQAYRLKLPAGFRNVHNTFHVSLLEPCTHDRELNSRPGPMEVDGDEHWEVQEVLDSKLHYHKLMYLVRWVGFPESDDQWLYPDAMDACQELISDFHKHYPDKPGQNKKRQRRK